MSRSVLPSLLSADPSTRRGRHARPARLPARIAVTTALGGALLPLALAGPAAAAERAATTTRVSGPGHSVQPGSAPVSVRLLSGRAYVEDAVVEVQVPEGSGWRTVAKAPTDSNGLAHTSVRVSRDTRVRGYYRGSAARTPSTSSSVVVDVADRGARVLSEAARHRGAPYRYGATGPRAFDCSGYTRYVYGRFGVSLPHNAASQQRMARRVSHAAARVGDLVFLDGGGHVGIYAGNGYMWDAPHAGAVVSRRKIYSSSYVVGRV